MILQAVVGGFVLDALFGDPAWLPHPVVLMGRCISPDPGGRMCGAGLCHEGV